MKNKQNRLKIAVIGLKGLPAFGGAAAVGENIIEQLKDKYDFTVYSVSSHTHLITGEYKGYRQVVIKKFFFKKFNTLYYYIISMLKVVLFSKTQIVHLHHSDAAFIIPFLRLKNKVIVTTHGTHNIAKMSKWKGFHWFFNVQTLFLKYATEISCVSNEEKKWLVNNYNLQVKYIPNGIILYNNKVFKFNIKEKDYIFFSAGRILKSKGCHLLLNALIELNYKGLVLIAGSLEHEPEYAEQILTLSKKLNVKFLGLIKQKEQLYGYLKYSKLFVYPSYLESMSMMLLEAASMKTPIICSDIPENKAVFSDDEVLFFKSNNEEDLAEKIKFAFEHPQELKEKALRAYDKLKRDYTWEKIAKQYENLYDNILSQ